MSLSKTIKGWASELQNTLDKNSDGAVDKKFTKKAVAKKMRSSNIGGFNKKGDATHQGKAKKKYTEPTAKLSYDDHNWRNDVAMGKRK